MKNTFRKICYFFLIFFTPLLLNAQWIQNINNSNSPWKWINPVPSNRTLYYTNFFNENTGYTNIDYRIFRTTNGGVNWILPGDTNTGNGYFYFQNINTGYKICAGGIYKTINSGVNWNFFTTINFPSFYIASISGIQDSHFNYSVTTYQPPFEPVASIRYTSNGGINWSACFPGAKDIFSLKLLRSDYAIGLASDSNKLYLLKSNLPWILWDKVYTGINEMYDAHLYVKDSITYFTTTSNSNTYKTTNAGQNWNQIFMTEIRDINFPSSNIGVAVGKNGKIYRSTDGCISWYQIQFPNFYNYEAVTFCNSTTGYITGDFGSFLKSTNAGANWFSDSKFFSKQNIRDVKTIGRDTAILCGDSGYVFSTYNQGLTWNAQKQGQNNIMTRIIFINKSTGYVIGRNGTVLKSVNSGLNWYSINTGITDSWMNDIYFINENTGFIAGNYLYKTTNGGNNFYLVNTPDYGVYAVRFINTNTGFISKGSGNIFRTTDIGVSWIATNTPQLSQKISDFQFINPNTGFAVGEYGYLLKTSDSGLNWIQIIRLNTAGLYRIKFINSLKGFITSGGGGPGGKSEIFFTTNGGNDWYKSYLDLDVWYNIIYSIDFANDSIGYAVGEYGMVLKTVTGGLVDVKKIETNIPDKFRIFQNYPNPFNPITNIKYQITDNIYVTLKVFDILGKEVTILVNEKQSPRTYEVTFDASQYPSGVYFYRLEAEGFTDTKKMILLK